MCANYNASTVAKWFVAWAEADDEATLSNLKLQKLLYYAQGHYLALTGRPLFDDEIQAWSHGPVVPAVYHQWKHSGSNDIRLPESDTFAWSDIDEETTAFLGLVWNTYGGFAAWKLRNMTHEEAPWRDHFVDGERSLVIPHDSMRDFFKPLTKA